jgi:hypothetical protein
MAHEHRAEHDVVLTAMVNILRAIGAVAVACVAALSTTILFTLVMMPFDALQSGSFYYTTGAAEGFLRGFAFVFFGSLIAVKRWRAAAALCLVPGGVGAYIYSHMQYSSSPELPIWHLSSCVGGGLVAAAIRTLRGKGQSASPNGGPAEVVGNSDAGGGPPSVS